MTQVAVNIALTVATRGAILSHPPLAPLQPPSARPMAGGRALFVDAASGSDDREGSEQAPWQSLQYALTKIGPGDTLYLRGGTYFENLVCSVAGTAEHPITIRSYPGELAIIDASLPEFQRRPADCWESVPDGGPDEYRSRQPYRNLRDVLGAFGDSMIGLQSYWYREDLRAENEEWLSDPDQKFDPLPVYCGPGLWYDKLSGHIHVRLSHTDIKHPEVQNYRGVTDPRQLPLIVAPFAARALYLDQAMHLRLQDLVLRGGGFDTVEFNSAIDIEFDNVTIYAGSYGLRSRGTGPFKFTNSAIHGSIPPWAFRTENCLRAATPTYQTPFNGVEQNHNRNVARLNTHALLVTEGSYEFEIFFYPYNHSWEIANSEFSDGHDGIYLSGQEIQFHHNHVCRIHDDAIYLSAPSQGRMQGIHVWQNLIRKVGMSFGKHMRGCQQGRVFIYRNICDQREPINWDRPGSGNPAGRVVSNLPLVTHGRNFLGSESVYFYHNLFIAPNRGGSLDYGYLLAHNSPDTSRWLLNNIFIYLETTARDWPVKGHGLSGEQHAVATDLILDGNIYWSAAAPVPERFIERIQQISRGDFAASYPHAFETHGQAIDPAFVAFNPAPQATNNYSLQEKSPARGAGVALPPLAAEPPQRFAAGEELPDLPAWRVSDGQRPDVGPVPYGTTTLHVGRHGAINALNFQCP